MSDFQVTVKEAGDVVVLATDGYLNNIGGEKISEVCDEHMENGKNTFLINLEKTSVVNSIGVSILIEIIEKLQESNGKLAYCNLAPIVEKTFNIMGLTKYSTIYSTEEEGLSDLSS
jgi:anti-anti-sigma factor